MTSHSGIASAEAYSSPFATVPKSAGQSKWQLLKTIEDIREPLGLKATSISLLRAMVSFLRVDQIDASRDDAHICFASNAALARRAHVSVQTIERHIAKLVSLGLLSRRSSGNGKRWARRDRQGDVVLATGLSLLPMATRNSEFVQLSQTHHDASLKLSQLRDRCAIALAQLKAQLAPLTCNETLLAKARNLMKRRPQTQALQDLFNEITSELTQVTTLKSKELRDTDPNIEGHKDTNINQSVKENRNTKIHVSQIEMERAFPRLCSELRFAQDQEGCRRLMDNVASQMQLSQTWGIIKDMGPALSFMILGYLLERTDTIQNHRGYAMKLSQDIKEQSINWRTLLRRPKSIQVGT